MSTVLEPTTNGTEMTALLGALNALRHGRSGVRLPPDWTGVAGKVADAFNDVVEQNERMVEELARLSRVVGKEGKLSQRLTLPRNFREVVTFACRNRGGGRPDERGGSTGEIEHGLLHNA